MHHFTAHELADAWELRAGLIGAAAWGRAAAVAACLRECAAELRHAAAPQPEAQPQWQPIETAPKDGRKLILSYINRNDMPRTVMARWLTDDEAAETDADGVGLEGGWYECIDNWDDYTEVAIHEGEPTHWMPLPAAPSAQAEPTACPHTGQCHPGFCPCSDAKRQAEQKGSE